MPEYTAIADNLVVGGRYGNRDTLQNRFQQLDGEIVGLRADMYSIQREAISDDKWMSLCRGLKTLFETKIGEPIDISDAEFMDVLKGAF